MRLIFWEPVLSPHKADLLRALARSPGVSGVTLVAQQDLPAHRQQLGWVRGDLSGLDVAVAPTPQDIRTMVKGAAAESVHIFSGMRRVPSILRGLDAVQGLGRRFGIMSEPRASEGLSGRLRFIQSWLTEGWLRKNADFVLAIGRNGPPWFESVGFAEKKVFPFAYFLTPSGAAQTERAYPDHPPRVTFLGRLDKEKGIHLFLGALELLGDAVQATVAGRGAKAALVSKARSRLPLTVMGAIPMAAVPELLAISDILVLPSVSTNDGWGAVVSEALFAGVAVVATDRVGASVCLADDRRGRVVGTLDASAVATAVRNIIDAGQLGEDDRAGRKAWGRRHLTAEAGAAHLLSILSHVYEGTPRPRPFYEEGAFHEERAH